MKKFTLKVPELNRFRIIILGIPVSTMFVIFAQHKFYAATSKKQVFILKFVSETVYDRSTDGSIKSNYH